MGRTEGKKDFSILFLKNFWPGKNEGKNERKKKGWKTIRIFWLTGCLLFTTMRNVAWTVLTIKEFLLFYFIFSNFVLFSFFEFLSFHFPFDRFSSDCTRPTARTRTDLLRIHEQATQGICAVLNVRPTLFYVFISPYGHAVDHHF